MTHGELLATLPARLKQLGVPTDIARNLVVPQRVTRATTAALEWYASTRPVLVLLGGNGCGKSHAACALVERHVIDNGTRGYLVGAQLAPWWEWRGCIYARARDLSALAHENAEDHQRLAGITRTSLLILDEAGNEDGDGERGLGRFLADRADGDGKRTVVTSNLSREAFAERYGPRLMSRIGADAVVVVHAKDLRVVA